MFTKLKENDNFLAVEIKEGDIVYAKLGSMVAYQGDVKFEKILVTGNDGMLKNMMTTFIKGVAGEGMDVMKMFGSGIVYLADASSYILEINMNNEGWSNLTIEGNRILSYSKDVQHKVKMSTFGTSSTKGLFTSSFSSIGNNANIALLSKGKPMFLPTPCTVDPQALIGYTGPTPRMAKNNITWKTFVGQSSGETFSLLFETPGHYVIVQPSEDRF